MSFAIGVGLIVSAVICMLASLYLNSISRFGGTNDTREEQIKTCAKINNEIKLGAPEGTACAAVDASGACRRGTLRNGSCAAPTTYDTPILLVIVSSVAFTMGIAFVFA